MGFSRQEYWGGLPCTPPGDLPDPEKVAGIEPASLMSHALAGVFFEPLRTVALQAPLSMGFSRQEDWSGLPCPPPGDLPDPGMEPASPALAGGSFTTEPPGTYRVDKFIFL